MHKHTIIYISIGQRDSTVDQSMSVFCKVNYEVNRNGDSVYIGRYINVYKIMCM